MEVQNLDTQQIDKRQKRIEYMREYRRTRQDKMKENIRKTKYYYENRDKILQKLRDKYNKTQVPEPNQ